MITYSEQQPQGEFQNGDEWHSPKGSLPKHKHTFWEGAWELVSEECYNEQQERAEAEQRRQGSGELSSGAGAGAQGDGDDGKSTAAGDVGRQQEPVEVTPKGEGVDENGSPVV